MSVVRRVEIIENLMAFFPQRQCELPVIRRRPYYASVGKAGFSCACIFSFKGALILTVMLIPIKTFLDHLHPFT